MNDPFFDEDDGEFDDLYGNPPPAAPSTVKQKPRSNEPPAMQPVTPGSRISARSPAASSSVISRSYARDSLASTTTDLAASATQDKRRKRRGKPRRKGSQELFDVQWQSDVKVAKCGLCRSDFSLVRRKHHCRHCGRVMCSDCSSFLYFEFSQRKHRVCVACNNQLLAEQEIYDEETGEQKASDLIEDSSDDGRPSVTPAASSSNDLQVRNRRSTMVNAFASKHGDDDEKARKKQEKKERKEIKKREKLERKGALTQVKTLATIPPREHTASDKDKPSSSLFDGADDDWFTDAPGQRRRSRESDDGYSEYGGSKGPGWRDRVKKNYTVSAASEQTSVLAPMTGSTLTGGITGKGYISDQFQYDDVGGPGLGHEDDVTVEMPRPKQESTTATYAGHSAKPSRLTGHGYFSEQFQYDVGGPGLGHDDDRSIAMPRPKQQPAVTPYSYDNMEPSERRSAHDSSENSVPHEQEFQGRHTFADNLKEMFSGTNRRESKAKTHERGAKDSKSRTRGNENMTLDELNPSYSSEDEPRIPASTMPRPAAQHTMYGNDADKRVADDSPGFFDVTHDEREAQRKVEEEQQRQLESDMAWVNSSAMPPTVPAHRFSSEQESYSIVDHPSHTSNSPVESRQGGSADEDGSGSAKGGFTGAIKRFFGMGSKGKGKRALTPPKTPSTVVTTPEKDSVDKAASKVPNSAVMGEPTSTALDELERHTVADYYGEDQAPQASFRNTIADTKAGVEDFANLQRVEKSMGSQDVQQKPERQRRGTFDDLFESPKANVTGNTGRYSTTGGWPARLGESTSGSEAPLSATIGVSRFDRRRSVDEADGLTFEDEPPVQHSTQGTKDPIEAWRRSAAMSLLNDSKDATNSEPSFTWSNVRSTPGFGTASYAVPMSLQPPAYTGADESSFQYDTHATQQVPLGNIMDDLKRVGTAKNTQGQESVDDFFAEFEEPNDYVFDPATGGYVAARAPKRTNIPQHVAQPEHKQHVVPHAASVTNSERDYTAATQRVKSFTTGTVASEKADVEDVGDEVAEIIVDKISSLENELAALKQLIRNRKGSGGSNKPRVRPESTKPRTRKVSIFDNDSSEEDNAKAGGHYSSPVRGLGSKMKSKRRPSSKKNHAKKRRDSFADLFEDCPNETSTLGGASSYEALFQTENKMAGRTKDVNSESDEELPPTQAKKRSKTRRRSSRKIDDHVSDKEDSGSESEFVSLKGRRGKESDRAVPVKSNPVDVVPVIKPVEVQSKEDPIDALFDISDGNDVAKLYGGDDYHKEEAGSMSRSPPVLEVLAEPPTIFQTGDDDEMKTLSSATATPEPVVTVNNGFTNSQALDEVDEEEEFSINWSKMRKTKSRRHKSRRGSSKKVSDDLASADLRLLELHPLDASPEAKVGVDEERKDAESPSPSSYLADAASNWMSASTLEEKDVSLSLTGDLDLSDLLQAVDENKDSDTISKLVATGEDKQDSTSNPVSVDDRSSTEVSAPIANLQNAILAEESDGHQMKDQLAKRKTNEDALVSPKLKTDKQNATFDIFDKSGDVDFLAVASQLSIETDHVGGDSDNEDGDKESINGDEEVFSFEVKTPKKKQYDLEVPAIIPSLSSQEESLPPSPASSMDENLELHKYTPTYAPSSVDGSLDDLEDISVSEEQPELGKAESEAFDTDWQQMQAKEKERKKKLQMKQRQAQRDKLLRKQGVSAKSLSNSDATYGSTRSKSKNGKKKKKKEKDTSDSTSSRQKKSSSSRKHRNREKDDGNDTAPSEPRSLTEL